MKTIILINGKKRHGKDYTASILKNAYDSEIMRFADPIKTIISHSFGILEKDLETYKNNTDDYSLSIVLQTINQTKEIKNINFREILQRFGTEAMKPIFGEDVWAQAMINRINNSSAKYIFIPDFRFGSELLNMLGFSPYVIKVINNDIVSDDLHPSEKELDDLDLKYDLILDNTGMPQNYSETVLQKIDELNFSIPFYCTKEGEKEIKRLSKLIKI